MSSFIVELGQKIGLMLAQFLVLAIFAGGLTSVIQWCNKPPETAAKSVVIHTVAIGVMILVFGIAIFAFKALT